VFRRVRRAESGTRRSSGRCCSDAGYVTGGGRGVCRSREARRQRPGHPGTMTRELPETRPATSSGQQTAAGRTGQRTLLILGASGDLTAQEGIDGDRGTETYAELVLAVDTWRWAGVPFRVHSGKAMSSPRTAVTVTFKPPQRVPTHLAGPRRARPAAHRHRPGHQPTRDRPEHQRRGRPVQHRSGDHEGRLRRRRAGALRRRPEGSTPARPRPVGTRRNGSAVLAHHRARAERLARRPGAAAGVPSSIGPEGWPPTGLPNR
jgi:hypothetical protein